MLKLKLHLFGHLMWRADSLEKTLMLGGVGSRRRRDNRGWDGWVASPTRWTWVWASSGSWWWTGRPGVLRLMGSPRVGHDWATDLSWTRNRQQIPEQGFLGGRRADLLVLPVSLWHVCAVRVVDRSLGHVARFSLSVQPREEAVALPPLSPGRSGPRAGRGPWPGHTASLPAQGRILAAFLAMKIGPSLDGSHHHTVWIHQPSFQGDWVGVYPSSLSLGKRSE